MKRENERVSCRFCGGEMKLTSKACPHCGSDEQTGWSEETYLDGIDLPDEPEYDDSLEHEFGIKRSRTAVSWQTLVGAAVLVVFITILLRAVL